MGSKSIITDNMDYCIVCGKPKQEIHHCIFGSRRKLADEDGLTIPLCSFCHKVMHNKGFMWKYYQKIAQKAFESLWGHDAWMERYKKNYL